MFLAWHTLIVVVFIGLAFTMGYLLGVRKKQSVYKEQR